VVWVAVWEAVARVREAVAREVEAHLERDGAVVEARLVETRL
tara:strand:+ start:189 stop:314 length:126 start_codon:yes stop_codon:yes gene_type:complete